MRILKPTDINHPVLSSRGDIFFALLAPQQLRETKALTEEQVLAIFEQGVKDPAIIDHQARLGRKAHLLTRHAQKILGSEFFLAPTDRKNPDVVIGVIDYTVISRCEYGVYMTRKVVADITPMDYIAVYQWV